MTGWELHQMIIVTVRVYELIEILNWDDNLAISHRSWSLRELDHPHLGWMLISPILQVHWYCLNNPLVDSRSRGDSNIILISDRLIQWLSDLLLQLLRQLVDQLQIIESLPTIAWINHPTESSLILTVLNQSHPSEN